MMKREIYLEKLGEIYRKQSFLASEVARKVALVGGAGCWFFRNDDFQFPNCILIALANIFAFFVFDILQYTLDRKYRMKVYDLVSKKTMSLPPAAEKILSKKYEERVNKVFGWKLFFLSLGYLFIVFEIIKRIFV